MFCTKNVITYLDFLFLFPPQANQIPNRMASKTITVFTALYYVHAGIHKISVFYFVVKRKRTMMK